MSSATFPVRDVLEGYLAGRVRAERVAAVVAAAYYGERGAESRDRLRPLMEIIERAHPGVIELTGATGNPGFAVRLADRPYPKEYEDALREAVHVALGPPERSAHRSPLPARGIWSRMYSAVRRFLSASA